VKTPGQVNLGGGDSGSTIVRRFYSLPLSHLLLALLCVLQPGAAHAASIPNDALDPVTADLAAGRADDAISRLNLSLTAQPADAEAHHLLCRVYYQEQRWDDAIHQCEAAVQLAPMDSDYHLWLGRAYGEKADSIHSIKAYGLAKKVKSEFERAVQLDSKNVDALSDLGEFYTAAPGIVGGGKDKAQGVVQKLEPLEPAQAFQLKGRLAEKDKNYPKQRPISRRRWKPLVRLPMHGWRWPPTMRAASNGTRCWRHCRQGWMPMQRQPSPMGPHWWMELGFLAATTGNRNLPPSSSRSIWLRQINPPMRPPSRCMRN
jgi:tetratricopeptide (TPR) repeat protein